MRWTIGTRKQTGLRKIVLFVENDRGAIETDAGILLFQHNGTDWETAKTLPSFKKESYAETNKFCEGSKLVDVEAADWMLDKAAAKSIKILMGILQGNVIEVPDTDSFRVGQEFISATVEILQNAKMTIADPEVPNEQA